MNMLAVEEKALLLDEFSSHVRRHFPPEVWRSFFEERTAVAQFGSATRTLLCADIGAADTVTRRAVLASMRRLSAASGGFFHEETQEYAFASFGDAEAALQTGVALQRLLPKARLRLGLSTGRCRMAQCTADGRDMRILLGQERARVQSLTASAAPGTLQMTPQDYDVLQDTIAHGLGSCLVIAELEEELVKTVTLTLPPDQAAEMSTFAGLGLTA
jgi:hypothetical protein